MSFSRRKFLQWSSGAAGVALMPARARAGAAAAHSSSILVPTANAWKSPDLHALAAAAVDAAKAAGASYADVRLTHQLKRKIDFGATTSTNIYYGVGVRALVNGYWGFMASAVWTPEEMARLARGAVVQAKANGAGLTRELDLGPSPAVVNGEWKMPVKYDPFEISTGEKMDIWGDVINALPRPRSFVTVGGTLDFSKEYKVFASSDGSRWAQTTYSSGSRDFGITYEHQPSMPNTEYANGVGVPLFLPAGRGWEYILESNALDAWPALLAEVEQMRYTTTVDVGKYDAVIAPWAVAALADPTLGAATELDRAMGYEANAGGTSYLGDPLEMLGTYKVGSAKVNVSADRSMSGGLATVKWDDEAVVPEPFPLVKDGILVDYQTTRDQAAWLAPYYRKNNMPVRSHGCAGAESALCITTQHAPNLRVIPGADDVTYEDMIKDTTKGIAIRSGFTLVDQQQLNGVLYPRVREIIKGKLGRYIKNAAVLFRAPELWRNVVAVGGPKTEEMFFYQRTRGEPVQLHSQSVSAVPVKIAGITLIDATRRL